MLRYFVFFVFSSIVVFSATVFFRLGGHKSVSIESVNVPAYMVIGKKHIGTYHKIGPAIETVEKWAKTNQIDCTKTFGEYLDDPREKDEDRLQSVGGCVIGLNPDGSTPNDLAAKLSILPADFTVNTIAAGPRVVAVFTGAPSIGPFKVYPAVEDFMQKKGLKISGPVIEIYEVFAADKARTEYQFRF